MSMDTVEFVNKMKRMCAKYPDCNGCPLETENGDDDCMAKVPAEQMVDIVEQWAKENSPKTRQSVFLEQWPNAELDCCGIIKIDPCDVDATIYQNCKTDACEQCRREFWMQEVE